MSQPEPESTPDKDIPKDKASSSSRDPLTVAWEAQEKAKATAKRTSKSSGKSFNAEPHPKAPALAEELSSNPKQDESGPKKDELPPPINTAEDIEKARAALDSLKRDAEKLAQFERDNKEKEQEVCDEETFEKDTDSFNEAVLKIRKENKNDDFVSEHEDDGFSNLNNDISDVELMGVTHAPQMPKTLPKKEPAPKQKPVARPGPPLLTPNLDIPLNTMRAH